MSDVVIKNPILPGFNPDPSILRVGADYYIATSTFQWFPGVQIHHSRDLVNWQLLTHPLTRVSQLDMAGNSPGAGIWAPCLSYHDGLFYLIYTNTRTNPGVFIDTPNYLVTAEDICGPWSEPVYLNSSGFDPSLFHDDDGRKWLVNMLWDHRPGANRFAGIVLQEYCPQQKKLVGPITNIYSGTELGATEGPHLYKINGWYYLMVAEGGTGYGHAVTVARSKKIGGPYETDPAGPVLTSRDRRWDPDQLLQKAGHASLTDTPEGQWYLAHLTGRPLFPSGRCPLGRETAIQKMHFSDDGWLRLAAGGHLPQLEVTVPIGVKSETLAKAAGRDDFDSIELNVNYATLRTPADESWLSLDSRPGWLRLAGRHSLTSCFDQSLLARRVQAFKFRTATKMQFEPDTFQQAAGLVLFYNVNNWKYIFVSAGDDGQKQLGVYDMRQGKMHMPLDAMIDISGSGNIYLAADIDRHDLQFSYSLDGSEWKNVAPVLDFSELSDEAAGACAFTGAMVGVCCQDMSGAGKYADFDWFEYTELNCQ